MGGSSWTGMPHPCILQPTNPLLSDLPRSCDDRFFYRLPHAVERGCLWLSSSAAFLLDRWFAFATVRAPFRDHRDNRTFDSRYSGHSIGSGQSVPPARPNQGAISEHDRPDEGLREWNG